GERAVRPSASGEVTDHTFRSFARNWVTLVCGHLIAGVISFAPFVLCMALTIVPVYLRARSGAEPGTAMSAALIATIFVSGLGSMVLWIMFAPALAGLTV